jgi:hypothetical protein
MASNEQAVLYAVNLGQWVADVKVNFVREQGRAPRFDGCVSAVGVHCMSGQLLRWTAGVESTPAVAKMGDAIVGWVTEHWPEAAIAIDLDGVTVDATNESSLDADWKDER